MENAESTDAAVTGRSASGAGVRWGALTADGYATPLLWLLVGTALLRLMLAAMLGLGIDEAYAVAVARPVQLSYFDHPPLVFWITALTEWLTGSREPWVLRVPFILCFAATTWFLASLGRTLYGPRAGFLTAVVVNLTGLFGVAHGSWILPDGPLLCALAIAADAVARVCFTRLSRAATARQWLIVGLAAGAAGLAKYHAIFLPVGVLLFLATTRRLGLLRSPWPWVAGAIAIALCTPVAVWNAQHDWASLRFQLGRAGSSRPGYDPTPFIQNVLGQIGYVLPWVWWPLMVSAAGAWRRRRGDERAWFLLCLAAGPLVVFTTVALLGTRALPHWQGPGYLFLMPLLGAALDARLSAGDRRATRWLRVSAGLVTSLAVLIGVQGRTGLLARLAPGLVRTGDPSLELQPWSSVPAAIDEEIRTGGPVAFVATTHWMDGARLGSVWPTTTRGADDPAVLVLSDDARHFPFRTSPRRYAGRTGLLVRRAQPAPLDAAVQRQFASIVLVRHVNVRRGGQPVIDLELYRVSGFAPTP
jgi:hypothetical protein